MERLNNMKELTKNIDMLMECSVSDFKKHFIKKVNHILETIQNMEVSNAK